MSDTKPFPSVLDAFPLGAVARREAAPADGGGLVEQMYQPGESVFGRVAHQMVANGWSVFPQEATGGRKPGVANGQMIKWSEDHRLSERLPEPHVLDLWAKQCSTLNVAVVLGRSAGWLFCVDVDVLEEELSAVIQELAERILGHTPFRRVGRWPKMALFYRHAEGDEVPGRSPKFAAHDAAGNVVSGDQGLEIISSGQAMTLYGKHHATGRYFRWLEASPLSHGPEAAPVVTSAQVSDFLDAVDSVRQFHKSQAFDSTITSWEWDEDAKIHVPRVRSSAAAANWVEDEGGIIVDGRESYLKTIVHRISVNNASAATDPSGEGAKVLARVVYDQFAATAEMSGKWKGRSLEREIVSKLRHMAARIASGDVKVSSPHRDERGEYITVGAVASHVPPQPRDPAGDSLDFLPPFAVEGTAAAGQRQPLKCSVREAEPGAMAERAISPDRGPVARAVADGLLASFRVFFDEVYDRDRVGTRVHILKAPTGAGKTSRSIQFIAEDPRTKEPFEIKDETGRVVHRGRCPVLYLLPTYANIEELRHRAKVLNLDPSLGDDELRAQAAEMDLIHEDDLPARVAELRRDAKNAGLVTMLYQGKLRAGCRMQEKVQLAMEAGIGTSPFCKAEVKVRGKDSKGNETVEVEERRCEFYDGCPAISQRDEIERCHVVFMPHAFLALNVPEELKNVRCVVADERIHHLFLHTTQFEADVLASPRRAPRLTKKETEEQVDPGEFVNERARAVRIVMAALRKPGACPVEALADDFYAREGAKDNARVLVGSALRVCSAAIQRDGKINPDMTLEEVRDLCSQPTGHQVREEHRFWSIVDERLEQRIEERRLEKLNMGQPLDPVLVKTKGKREYRIQAVQDTMTKAVVRDGRAELEEKVVLSIRLSWRGQPNWLDRPLLLLDASAAPDMIEKIWKGKEVKVHDIPASLNVRVVGVVDRTYSNSSVIAPPSASPQERVSSGKLLNKVRRALSLISGAYGWSRVVAGGSILVRKAVNTSWAGPENVDWCHFGAMRGLDFAKHHAAAVSVGRMELPVRTIDGLVAALTYDDDQPEEPFDTFGTGLSVDGMPLRIPMGVQRVRMRSGHDVEMPVPMFPGRWGRMIQRQYREEELLQFLGRLRPVYREGEAPIWFSLTSVIPEEVIVDDLINLDDLLKAGVASNGTTRVDMHVWEAIRRTGGVLDPDVSMVACDDLYPSRRAAAKDMRAAGMDPETGAAAGRLSWGMVALSWSDGAERSGRSFVRADLSDPEATLRDALARYLGISGASVERVSQSRGQTMARGRTPDKIEDELGTHDARRTDEIEMNGAVARRVFFETPASAFAHQVDRRERILPVMVPVAIERADEEGKDQSVRASLADLEAQEAITLLWKRLGRGVDGAAVAAKAAADLGFAAAVGAVLPGDGPGDGEPLYENGAAHVVDRYAELLVASEYDEYDELIPW